MRAYETWPQRAGLGALLIAAGTWLMIQRRQTGAAQRGDNAWLLYAAVSAVFAALTSILAKIGIQGVDSTLGTAIRTAVVVVMAWLVVYVTGKQGDIARIDRRSAAIAPHFLSSAAPPSS